MDMRSNTLVRPTGAVDRDREMLRLPNSGAVQGEDRTLSIGIDGWEKTKMKKKRSGIKPDASPSTIPTKPMDGYREIKQGMQQRPVSDARSRLNNDSHGFRYGFSKCYCKFFLCSVLDTYHNSIHYTHDKSTSFILHAVIF